MPVLANPSEWQDVAPWMDVAFRELGMIEIPGPEDNPRVVEYLRTCMDGATDDEVPWCSAFVNWSFEQTAIIGTNNLGARSWLRWGVPLSDPKPGCVVVLWRGQKDSWKGHVGFYLGTNGTKFKLLGGNQHNSVSLDQEHYAVHQLLGYRWPAGLGQE